MTPPPIFELHRVPRSRSQRQTDAGVRPGTRCSSKIGMDQHMAEVRQREQEMGRP